MNDFTLEDFKDHALEEIRKSTLRRCAVKAFGQAPFEGIFHGFFKIDSADVRGSGSNTIVVPKTTIVALVEDDDGNLGLHRISNVKMLDSVHNLEKNMLRMCDDYEEGDEE